MRTTKLKRKVYESKTARDLLDEEFVEFGPVKRNINEFFDLYSSKFYNIIPAVHDFFSKESTKYVTDYVNPKQLQVEELERQRDQLQIDIDSIEKSHPIFPNNTVLRAESDSNEIFYLVQSGKRRRIVGDGMVQKVKEFLRQKNKDKRNWTIKVQSDTISGMEGGGKIETDEDLRASIYKINTGKELPSNIYIG